MAFQNPDFTKLSLDAAPARDEAAWKKQLEAEVGKKYDDIGRHLTSGVEGRITWMELLKAINSVIPAEAPNDAILSEGITGAKLMDPASKPGRRSERSFHRVRPADPSRLRRR